MGILIIPIGITLFAQQFFFLDMPFGESIVSMVAAVVGMIPEGLYLLASVALLVSVMRLASKKVLFQWELLPWKQLTQEIPSERQCRE